MALHAAVDHLVSMFVAMELHAARSGREVMGALTKVVADSSAGTPDDLASEIEASIAALVDVMPPYAPPINVMHSVMSCVEGKMAAGATVAETKSALLALSDDFEEWSRTAQSKIAEYGAGLIARDASVFTFTRSETVLRTLVHARASRVFKVIVTESRPNNDGIETVTQLSGAQISVLVGIDAGVGELVPMADVAIVGAEGIEADGSAICKVGTYLAALAAKSHGVPFYVVVDTLKLNVTSMLGLRLRVDAIAPSDVLPVDASSSANVVGHLFDRTPPELITGVVTERGIVTPSACMALMLGMPVSSSLVKLLRGRN